MQRAAPHLPGVSIVIPVLGDHAPLATLLALLRGWDDPALEIVVADGDAGGSCRDLARRHGARHVTTLPGRGQQLHAGALAASREILWFLHADATPAPDSLALIRQHILQGGRSGHFRFRFTGPPARHKSLLAGLINLRVRLGVPYGDQGIFCTRSAYDAAGGFPAWPLFEEVPLVQGLRPQGGFAALDRAIGVSPRRWERDGWLRRSLANRLLATGFLLGIPAERLARAYRPLTGPSPEDGGPAARSGDPPC